MVALTVSLFVIGYGFKSVGKINRWEGILLMLSYVGYMLYLVLTSTSD
jgi:cation:H+ antiporter